MATDFLERCEVIEQCYEFLLAYAGQGLPTDEGSSTGGQVRSFLDRAGQVLRGLAESCGQAIKDNELEPAEKYSAFCSMLDRDVQDSLAAIDLVLAQPSISSQLIDNLNASSHLRALLTDLFLIGEILRTRGHTAVVSTSE
ncbi:MAG: hypothetical protein WA869_22635 [Alloacidobacterium sp.]|jgi:hypothetical protein